MLKSFFKRVAVLQACKFIKKILQHRCFPAEFTKILRTPILKKHFLVTASETCSFIWTTRFDNLHFWLKFVPLVLVFVSQFTVSFANSSFTTIYAAIIRSSRSVGFCKTVVLTNIAKFIRKHLR